jgi:hypothetical protein
LLKDYRPFKSAFGGAMPLDETGVRDASYGPAGIVLTGVQFEKRDVELLAESYDTLDRALRELMRHDFQLWASLIEPYLSDIADNSVVEDWREKLEALDKENAARRKAKKPERVALVYPRLQLMRHEKAVEWLTDHLKGEDLHVVFPKLMSERERAAGDAANAQIYAYYQRVRVAGRTHRGAISQTAVKFEMPEDAIERVVEFRSDVKLASCAETGCKGKVFQQNMCVKHYNRDYRARKKMKNREGAA